MTPMHHESLLAAVRRVRRRWRLRVALEGAAVVLGVAVALLLLGGLLLGGARFTPFLVQGFRILGWTGLAAAAGWVIVRPLLRRVSDERIALYIEEHEPDAQALVVSAVEQAGAGTPVSPLADQVVARAVERLRASDEGRRIERRRLRIGAGAVAVAAMAALALGLGPDRFRTAARVLFMPWDEAAAAPALAVLVEPGNASVARGGDLDIAARLRGFTAARVELLLRTGDDPEWQRLPMAPDDSGARYLFRLFDVTEQALYVVEANGIRSPQYTLTVVDLPTVGHFTVELRYPAHTGLGTETRDPGGDIVAPRGTTARFTVTPTMPTRGGRVMLASGDTVGLSLREDGTLEGSLRLTAEDGYRFELLGRDGRYLEASLGYRIDLLDDLGPTVIIRTPGRDAQATAVEEVFVEAEATDDFGVRSLELVYRVNGGEETVVPLHRGGRRLVEASGGHTLFLEEMGLVPGDVIAYYARATDNAPGAGTTAASDIYFLRVRPFDREYRQADQQGAPAGQQGNDTPEGLSEQQRQIVAGTFKVQRDRAASGEERVREDLATLALAQGRLRQRVIGLLEQMTRRNAAAMDTTFRVVQRELQAAVAPMQVAEEALGRRQADDALGPEQQALTHLQRAEEAFREVRVSFGGQPGGGGGSAAANAEDLADLFELETDKLRNQYESVERSRQQEAQREVDETLERLRQLASRQQQENERLQRAAEQMRARGGQSGASGSGGGGAQRQLAQEAEELARRLERLVRERPTPEVADAARRMREAADAMRRAASQQGTGGEAQGTAAAERLRQAARSLESSRGAALGRAIEEAERRASDLAEREREIARDVDRALRGGRPAAEQARALAERKDSLAADVGRLEADLDRLSREAGSEQPAAGRGLQGAANGLRDDRVRDKIRFSKSLLGGASPEYARNFEEQIAANLDSAAARIRAAGDARSRAAAQDPERALDRARQLVRGLESLSERLRNRGADGQRQAGQQGQQGEQGQQGQQGQAGQPGGQAGGQAREGQPAGGPADPDGSTTGGRPAWAEPGTARQFTRELRERRLGADSLRAEVERLGLDPRELDRIIAEIRRLESGALFSDPSGLERLDRAVLERLKAFEFALRRQLGSDEGIRPVIGPGDQVPPGFRELVEEYYRALARSGRGAPRP